MFQVSHRRAGVEACNDDGNAEGDGRGSRGEDLWPEAEGARPSHFRVELQGQTSGGRKIQVSIIFFVIMLLAKYASSSTWQFR